MGCYRVYFSIADEGHEDTGRNYDVFADDKKHAREVFYNNPKLSVQHTDKIIKIVKQYDMPLV